MDPTATDSSHALSLSKLEEFIDHCAQSYIVDTVMAHGEHQQTQMDIWIKQAGSNKPTATSTPLPMHEAESMNTTGPPIDADAIDADATVQTTSKPTLKKNATSSLSEVHTDIEESLSMHDSSQLISYLEKMTLAINNKISESSKSLTDQMTEQANELTCLKEENQALRQRSIVNEGRLFKLERVVADLKEDVLRGQQHSMKENIIFQNIPENPQENVYKTLHEFMNNNLRMSQDNMSAVHILKAHRMGKKDGPHPRRIVAKINDEGRYHVFQHAKNLKGSRFSVFTQLPRELSERRGHLVPYFKDARSKKIPAKWFGDKLQVNGKVMEYTPDRMLDINIDPVARSLEMKVTRRPPTTHDGCCFQASRVSVTNRDDVIPAIQAIGTDLRVSRASHNVYAYRLQQGTQGPVEHFEDDGDFGAGTKLLQLLRAKNITNKLVCVTQWRGNRDLGLTRFKIYTDTANEIL